MPPHRLPAAVLSLALAVVLAHAFSGAFASSLFSAPAAALGRTAALTPASLGVPPRQESKLMDGEDAGAALFGYTLAISADGDTAVVGAPGFDENRGAAWVFTRSGSTWVQQGTALFGGGERRHARFGYSVALSGDGQTILIGGPRDRGHRGAAWVFAHEASGWAQQAELTGGEEESGGAGFGDGVALSADGDTALVGASADEGDRGAVWAFTRTQSTWAQQGPKLTGGGEEVGEGLFGHSLALSGDGDTALIGASGDDGFTGAAWTFTRSGSTWAQAGAKLTATEEDGAGRFGYSVALSGDAQTAVVGARTDADRGAAWIYARSGDAWTQQSRKLTGGEEERGHGGFGYSVALSGDGATALIGAPRDSRRVGAAWLFTRVGDVWREQSGKLTGREENGPASFGEAVALSADGQTALIGGARDDAKLGAVWTLSTPEPSPTSPGSGGGGEGEEEPGGAGGEGHTTSVGAATDVSGATGAGGVLSTIERQLPAPQLGVSGNLTPVSGEVLVKLPGSRVFVALTEARQVAMGTIVEATHGTVAVTTMGPHGLQTMDFYGGRFRLTQRRDGLVIAVLSGGDFSVCPTRRERAHTATAASGHASGKHVVRKLWSSGHGSYSTKGNYASGAVLGTRWLTEDRCDGTLIYVATDRVAVTNLVTHRRRTVTAGHRYLAKAP